VVKEGKIENSVEFESKLSKVHCPWSLDRLEGKSYKGLFILKRWGFLTLV
jgi:hypothetical protein